MFTKKIVVLGSVVTALVALTMGCSADATGDNGESTTDALENGGGGFTGAVCPAGTVCHCSGADDCHQMVDSCAAGTFNCTQADKNGNCVYGFCTGKARTTTVTPHPFQPPTVSGSRLAL